MCDGQPGGAGTFADAAEAAAAAQAALAFLATADVASLPGDTLAECLRALAGAESGHLAARSRVLSAFTAQDAPVADGHPTAKSWLRWQTRVTAGAAGAEVGWMRRLAAHPRVAAALAAQAISPSWALQVCKWTDELPAQFRDDADEILLAAADGGADLADLSGLAREIYERTVPPDADDGPPGEDPAFRDRWLRLDVTFGGAGRLEAALTPECTAAVLGMLESLGKKAAPGDDRSEGQRHHDALEEACRMLLATGTLPDVAGQPAQLLVHATLGQLLGLAGHGGLPGSGPGSAGLGAGDDGEPGPGLASLPGVADAFLPRRGAGHGPEPGRGLAGVPDSFLAGRAAGDGEPGWAATPAAAQAYACDAKIATIITGHLDPEIVAAAVRAYLGRPDPAAEDPAAEDPVAGSLGHQGCASGQVPAATHDRLAATLIRYVTAMLTGPAGLAAALRAGLPGSPGAAVSLPLDITSPTATIPPHLRRAVTARDRHCAFPGCGQVPARCQVHHVIPRSLGGPTALPNLVLLCSFHHLILIHRRGWTLTLNADGTTTATSPDGRKVWHSHDPPDARAA